MNPLLLSGLVGMGGQAASTLGTFIPTAAERTQKRDLKELQRLQEMNALGLTDKEQAAMVNKLSQSANMQQQQSMQDRARLLAGGGTATGGQAMQEAVALDAARAAQQERVGQVVLEADLAREQEQKDKLAALEAAAAQIRTDRINAIGGIVGAGIESAVMGKKDEKGLQGAKAPSPQLIAQAKQTYGFTDDKEAIGFIELSYTDPKAADIMGKMILAKAQGRGAQ
jgi:hypothetical protein